MNLEIPVLTIDTVIDGSTLLVEFNDGSFKSYHFEPGANWRLPSYRWLTREQLVAAICAHNSALRPMVPVGYHPPSSRNGAAFWR